MKHFLKHLYAPGVLSHSTVLPLPMAGGRAGQTGNQHFPMPSAVLQTLFGLDDERHVGIPDLQHLGWRAMRRDAFVAILKCCRRGVVRGAICTPAWCWI